MNALKTAEIAEAINFLESGGHFRALFEESPCPMSVQGPDFRLLAVNRAYVEKTGFEADQLIGRDPIELLAPASHPAVYRERAMKSDETLATSPLLRSLRCADGTERTFRLFVKPIALGTLGSVYVTTLFELETRDVREHDNQIMNERFRRLLDQAPVGLVVTDLAGRVSRVNVEFLRLTATTTAELHATGPLFLDASSQDVASGTIGSGVASPNVDRGDDRHRRELWQRPDGQSVWLDRVTQVIEAIDGTPARLTVVKNVTREMQAYAQLQAAMNEYRVLLDATAAGVLKLQHGRINRVNQSLEALFGVRSIDLLGRSPVFAFGSRQEFRAWMTEANRSLARGENYASECRLRRADGQFFECEIQCRRVVDSDARAGMIVTVHDISDLRAQERDRMHTAAAQHKVLTREIHHRIKNNLQGVAGLIQSLAARRPELGEILSGIAGQIRAMGQVYGLQQIDGIGSLSVNRLLQSIITGTSYPFSTIRFEEVDVTPQDHRWRFPEQEVIPFALIINELLTNAVKHGAVKPDVRVQLRSNPLGCDVIISNIPRAGASVNIIRGQTLDSGLGLVRAMMPSRHAELDLQVNEGRVVARLSFQYPAVVMMGQNGESLPPAHVAVNAVRA